MAQESLVQPDPTLHTPELIYYRGGWLKLDCICPITNDAVYERTKDDGTVVRVIAPNPFAAAHQAKMLTRGS